MMRLVVYIPYYMYAGMGPTCRNYIEYPSDWQWMFSNNGYGNSSVIDRPLFHQL